LRLLRRVHRDQQGTISIVSVFAVMLLTMLLGMVMNVGRHVDGKIRMQNAADAAAYSGGTVMARGMNTLTFTNHLLFDVFALTAFMREARDRNAEGYVPEILDAWEREAPKFDRSGFPKFERLGPAIRDKAPLEQELVRAFSEWAAAVSERVLPVLEEILRAEMIPQFQRAVVETYPVIAQMAAEEVAERNGAPAHGRGAMVAALWRTDVLLVGANELSSQTMPVLDPLVGALTGQGSALSTARRQRRNYARLYLGIEWGGRWSHHTMNWNDQTLAFFDNEAKMSRFASLWRRFTCGQLERLLEEEYPYTNLPHVIRTEEDEGLDRNTYLERHFTYLGVVYWRELPAILPGLFRDPIEGDSIAFAEVRVFVPHRRLQWCYHAPSASDDPIGGMPGNFPPLPPPPGDPPPAPADPENGRWHVHRQHNIKTEWDLINQHWTAQIVPTTQGNLAEILQTPPAVPAFAAAGIRLPSLGNMSTAEIGRISTH